MVVGECAMIFFMAWLCVNHHGNVRVRPTVAGYGISLSGLDWSIDQTSDRPAKPS